MYASRLGHTKCVRQLRKFKAGANARSMGGRTALMHAAQMGRVESIRELLRGDSIIQYNGSDDTGITALMYASMPNRESKIKCECVRELLNVGADVNARDHLQFTAFMWAVDPAILSTGTAIAKTDDDCCMVRELLKAKPDLSAKNIHGRNAYEQALGSGRHACVKLLS